MADMYTLNGRPLKVDGDDIFSASGEHVARLRNGKAYSSNGDYVGTVVGDRLIYRSTESATISSPFAQRASAGFSAADAAGSAQWGDEPPISD